METYVLYGLIAGGVTLFAGIVPLYVDFKGIRYVIAVSAGVVIATAFLDMMPEVDMKQNAWIMAAGFLVFYVVGKLTMLHACGEMECHEHSMNMVSILGMSLDNVIDGIAITVGYLTDPHLGLVIMVAVVIHEIPQDITATLIMKGLGYSTKKMLVPIIFAAVSYPIGAYIAVFIPESFHGPVIAFISGTFIYIGVADLLTEAHKKFNAKVVFSVIAGFILVFLLESVMGH